MEMTECIVISAEWSLLKDIQQRLGMRDAQVARLLRKTLVPKGNWLRAIAMRRIGLNG